jgi:hypothetical protein
LSPPRIALLTPTWRGDFDHFRLLRRSLTRFGMGDAEHHVVVQTEDRELFAPLVSGGMRLHTTADILPPEVEAGRVECLRRSRHDNRHMARLRRSLNKRFGWYNWIRHYGWQIQQITKLQAPAVLDADIFVVLDSDLILCKPLRLEEFAPNGKALLMECPMKLRRHGPGLEHRWAETAHRLLERPFDDTQEINARVGTPFVFDRQVVLALHQELEQRHRLPWHQTLLRQKPASWSEFALYNCLATAYVGQRIQSGHGDNSLHNMVLDSKEDKRHLLQRIMAAASLAHIRFVTLQSTARWSPAELAVFLETGIL